jgi:hypothetical protein
LTLDLATTGRPSACGFRPPAQQFGRPPSRQP